MILINILGFALIGAIVWWFWLYTPPSTAIAEKTLLIEVVDGVYIPSSVEVKAGQNITVQFKRTDPSPCAETVIFPALEVSATLQIGDVTQVALGALAKGEYAFHCQMQMYRGVLKVV
ncbi:cupredoxin domain-containing protein [Pseudoalteromonas sp. SSDWG2]|uniref:cupredoxin domain-containing protein n=1 Tax=Pseudoalteromonas sp. SSDWG2 TaxID=3139391 RepID=UPI003BA84BF6